MKQRSTSLIPIRVSRVQLFGASNNSFECCFEEVKRGGRGLKIRGELHQDRRVKTHTQGRNSKWGVYEPTNRLSLKFNPL